MHYTVLSFTTVFKCGIYYGEGIQWELWSLAGRKILGEHRFLEVVSNLPTGKMSM